jgi:hypothetical protein
LSAISFAQEKQPELSSLREKVLSKPTGTTGGSTSGEKKTPVFAESERTSAKVDKILRINNTINPKDTQQIRSTNPKDLSPRTQRVVDSTKRKVDVLLATQSSKSEQRQQIIQETRQDLQKIQPNLSNTEIRKEIPQHREEYKHRPDSKKIRRAHR